MGAKALIGILMLTSAAWCGNSSANHHKADTSGVLACLSLQELNQESVNQLKKEAGFTWWVELEDQMLVRAPVQVLEGLLQWMTLEPVAQVSDDRLLFVSGVLHDQSQGSVLARGGRFAVVAIPDHQQALNQDQLHTGCHGVVLPFKPNTVLAARHAPMVSMRKRTVTQALVNEVNDQRWFDDIVTLSSYHRTTGSAQCDESAQWLFDEFSALPGLEVSFQPFTLSNGSNAANVVATIQGSERPDEWYVVGAHYDSIGNMDAGITAPGAEDNASGTAAVLEMARIFSEHPPKATIIFICYSGEEQGLRGSIYHINDIIDRGEKDKLVAVLTMDMIAYTSDGDYDVLLETSTLGQPLIDVYAQAAANYTPLRVVTSLNPFGSDHVPYLNENVPALLVIQNDWAEYPSYHRSTDLPQNLGLVMGSETLKMNVAALVAMVGLANEDNLAVSVTFD